MRSQRVWCFALFASLSMVLVSSLTVQAQTPAPQPLAPLPLISGGQRVWVTTADGRVFTGNLVLFTPAGVVVRKGGADARIEFGDVRRIEVPDRLGNGIRNGAIVGAVFYGAMSAAFAGGECDHGCGGVVAFVVVGSAFGAALGAGIGALVDYLIVGRDVIYSAPPPASVRFAPILAPTRAGMAVRIAWR
jgi:hypothetical protein